MNNPLPPRSRAELLRDVEALLDTDAHALKISDGLHATVMSDLSRIKRKLQIAIDDSDIAEFERAFTEIGETIKQGTRNRTAYILLQRKESLAQAATFNVGDFVWYANAPCFVRSIGGKKIGSLNLTRYDGYEMVAVMPESVRRHKLGDEEDAAPWRQATDAWSAVADKIHTWLSDTAATQVWLKNLAEGACASQMAKLVKRFEGTPLAATAKDHILEEAVREAQNNTRALHKAMVKVIGPYNPLDTLLTYLDRSAVIAGGSLFEKAATEVFNEMKRRNKS